MKFGMLFNGLGENAVPIDALAQGEKTFWGDTLMERESRRSITLRACQKGAALHLGRFARASWAKSRMPPAKN